MLCKKCNRPYERMAGVLAHRIDYGYCSLDCAIQDKPPCERCGEPIVRGAKERLSEYMNRRFCGKTCARLFNGGKEKSAETRQKMREHALNRPPEHNQKVTEARARFYASADGKDATERSVKGHAAWRAAHPDQVAEMLEKQAQTRRERGLYEANSQRMKAFYQTPEGAEQKAKFSALYTGKPRPLRVTQQMKASLRMYWDSPEGMALREAISQERTGGLEYAPYGPGWNQKSAKIRQRDGCCVVCGTTEATLTRKLDVHHIYARRKFGYIPGQNRNYLWANHSANLISLCQACHRKIEMHTLEVPLAYQILADQLWQEFVLNR